MRLCMLPPGSRVKDTVDACRSAALAFTWGAGGAAGVWGRRDLARWLVSAYARATASTKDHSGTRARVFSGREPLAEETISSLVCRSHAEIVDALRESYRWRADQGFARDMIEAGLVCGVMDDDASLGYAPVDRPRMGLFDRVVSLFVADYLTRPADYAAFGVCEECLGVVFDCHAHLGDCDGDPAPLSLVRPAAPRRFDTLPYFARRAG